MVNTSNITMLMTFIETSQTIIFNTTMQSMQDVAKFIQNGGYRVNTVKQYDANKEKFVRVSKNSVRLWCDHCTELDQIFEKQSF